MNPREHLSRKSSSELEGLLVGKYANEGTAVEAMRNLMTLAQLKSKSLRELGGKD